MKPELLDRSKWNLGLLQALDWKVFEEVTVDALRMAGHQAVLTPPGPDGGVDIIMTSRGSEAPDATVQCKRHKKPIELKRVREFLGSATALKFTKKIFITTSTFHKTVQKEFGDYPEIVLIDGQMFLEGIEALGPENATRLLQKFTFSEDFYIPTCPGCDIKMVRQITKNGKNVGNKFWGCPNFSNRTDQCHQKLYSDAFPDYAEAQSAEAPRSSAKFKLPFLNS
jgi:restriction system protein